MKIPCLLIALLIANPLWATDEKTPSNATPTNSSWTPLNPSTMTSQVEAKVLKTYIVRDGDAVFKAYVAMWKDQEVVISDMRAQSNLKEGDTIKFVVMKVPNHRGGQNSEILSFMISPEVKIPIHEPRITVVNEHRQPVFFECRGNELFYVDKDALDAQVAQFRASNPNGVPQNNAVVGDSTYTMDPVFFSVGMMRLKHREGVHGQNVANLASPTGQYQTILKRLDPKKSQLMFFQRTDSGQVGEQAEKIAKDAGFFMTNVQILPNDDPLSFGIEKPQPSRP